MTRGREHKAPIIPTWSFWGTGITLAGYRPRSDGTYLVTRWLTVLFLPLIPLNSWIISLVKSEGFMLGTVVGAKHKFCVLRKVPLTLREVARTLAQALGLAAIGLIPAAYTYWHFHHFGKSVILFFAAVVWPIVIIGWVDHRVEKLYDQAEEAYSPED